MSLSPSQKLRLELRQLRRNLPQKVHKHAALALSQQLFKQPLFLRSKHIACYLQNDGEINLEPVIQQIWQMRKQCYLPVLHPQKRGLWFLPYTPQIQLQRNKFNILEPVSKQSPFPAWALDLVLTPLVAFDQQGNRLGMGGGYYDASFAYLNRRQHRKQPVLLGTAFECQRLPLLPETHSWDIPLQGAITEVQAYWF